MLADRAAPNMTALVAANAPESVLDQEQASSLCEGKKHRPAREGLYYCNDCKGSFTLPTKTAMVDSHVPLNKWVYAFREFMASKNGVSAHQLHRRLASATRRLGFSATASRGVAPRWACSPDDGRWLS